jgi:hypothetical protein
MTAASTIPSTDVTGLGTMSIQNSNNISVTGGSMSGVTISDYVATATKGVANGVASLDGSGTVPVSQLPAAVLGALSYQGTWNASTNSPTLTSSVGTKGYYYVVNVAGSTNLNGITDWVVGDWAVFNGSVWQKVDNTDAVTSVNGLTGTVVLTQSNITGTVAIANGGTGQTTATAGFNALAPSQTGNTGKYLTTDGTNTSWATNSGGDVTGPSSATDNAIARYDGTTGKLIKNSGVTVDNNNNVTLNASFNGFTSVAASGTQIVLTAASTPVYLITGSGGQTIKLPDATTLPNGVIFSFNNNQSSGAITVNNNSNTLIVSVPSGGYTTVVLLSNAIAAGSWDRHDQTPANVSWSTNTFDYAGSFTSGTWNGNAVAYNRGGTGQSSAFTAGGIVYGSTTSALAVTPIGTTGQVLTSAGAGTPTWTTPTTGTVTSVTGTAPVVSSGGNTPAISMPAATSSVNGYLTSADWTTFNGKQPAGTYVTSVAATSPVTSSGGTTPTIAMPAATASVSGYLTSTDWNTFNNKGSGTVTSVTGTAPVVSSGGATPAISMAAATGSVNGYLTSTDWTTFNSKGSGSVTSVAQSFTGGLISVAGSPITTSGTLALTVAGTSGGIPYFSSASTWATSAALASNALVVGGGAGVAPATTTTGTGVVTALGVNTGTAGAFVVNGGALGTPSSGTVTNLTGTASININGTVGATTASTGVFTTCTATTYVGVSGGTF